MFTSLKRIKKLRHAQSLRRISSDKDVVIIPCNPGEPICKDQGCQTRESTYTRGSSVDSTRRINL